LVVLGEGVSLRITPLIKVARLIWLFSRESDLGCQDFLVLRKGLLNASHEVSGKAVVVFHVTSAMNTTTSTRVTSIVMWLQSTWRCRARCPRHGLGRLPLHHENVLPEMRFEVKSKPKSKTAPRPK
jgi:hypothetical protein